MRLKGADASDTGQKRVSTRQESVLSGLVDGERQRHGLGISSEMQLLESFYFGQIA